MCFAMLQQGMSFTKMKSCVLFKQSYQEECIPLIRFLQDMNNSQVRVDSLHTSSNQEATKRNALNIKNTL